MKPRLAFILLASISCASCGLVRAHTDQATQQPSLNAILEHGAIVAVRTPAPNLAGGVPGLLLSRGTYREETSTEFYEFLARGRTPEFTVGQSMDFKADSGGIFLVGQDGIQHRYRVLSVEKKTGGVSNNPSAATQ